MNHWKIFGVLCVVLLLCGVFAGTVSARTGTNAVLAAGNTIYIGESGLNVSLVNEGKTPQYLIAKSSGANLTRATITNNITGLVSGLTGETLFVQFTDGSLSSASFPLQEPQLGTLKIRNTDTGEEYNENANIPNNANITFYLSGSNIVFSQLVPGWLDFRIKNTGTNVQAPSIFNLNGEQKELKLIPNPAVSTDTTYYFTPKAQNVLDTGKTVSGQILVQEAKLNGLNLLKNAVSVPFRIVEPGSVFTVKHDGQVEQGEKSFVITFTGMASETYNMSLTPYDDYRITSPYFSAGDYSFTSRNDTIQITPASDGSISIQLTVPVTAQIGGYQLKTVHPKTGNTLTTTFSVIKGTDIEYITLTIPEDAKSGAFASGDMMKLSGSVGDREEIYEKKAYLYITGPGLPANGANLETYAAVVDGDPSTFTAPTGTTSWEYQWFARLDPGTYTIHATLNMDGTGPYGYLSSKTSSSTGAIGGKVPPSEDFTLSEQSFAATLPKKIGTTFVQGGPMYAWFSARGSPGVSLEHPNAEVRWYIFGTNFRYADYNDRIPLSSGDATVIASTNPDILNENVLGGAATWIYNGFTYGPEFTESLSPGTYYLVFQHPGINNKFDVFAGTSGSPTQGPITTIGTTYGKASDFSGMQSGNAANALVEMIEDPKSDDLYVMLNFLIEEPWMSIDSIDPIGVGDSLKISGKTNLASSDETPDGSTTASKLSLTIHRLDFDTSTSSTGTAMKIPTSTTDVKDASEYRGYKLFEFGSIDTATWYPGTYEVTVLCKEENIKQSYTFSLLTQDEKTAALSGAEKTDPGLSPTAAAPTSRTPLVTPTPTPTTPAPTLTQADGSFGLLSLFGLGILVLFRRRD